MRGVQGQSGKISNAASLIRLICFFCTFTWGALHAADPCVWDSSQSLHPGVDYLFLAVVDPKPLKIHAVRIDTQNQDLYFHTSSRSPLWGKPMKEFPQYTIRTNRTTTRQYFEQLKGEGNSVIAAINASPWSPWSELDRWGKQLYPYADITALAISKGEMVAPANKRPAFMVYKDGTPAILHDPSSADLSMVQTAAGGFGMILENGYPRSSHSSTAPRTAIGICQEGRFVYWMVIDGRQPGYSEGATLHETGSWLRHLGAWNGLNMDGGGSSTLVTRYETRFKAILRNRPSEGWPPLFTLERPTANHLAILEKDTTSDNQR
jgi:hypothetical protein